MPVTNDLVNRVSLTKADLLEALRDYLFKNSARGDTSVLKEVNLIAVTDFEATAMDYVLVKLVLDLDN